MAAGERVEVMENEVVRRLAVSSSVWLDPCALMFTSVLKNVSVHRESPGGMLLVCREE